MASGIKDKVAILGMGCTKFGERWDVGTHQLMAEAFEEALVDAGIERKQIDAAWYGSCLDEINVGNSSIPASLALRLEGVPVSRMENMCATGTEALRGAVYAVASGAVDIALAIGAEKLKDTGYGGLPAPYKGTLNDLWLPLGSAPAGFAQLAAGYRAKHGVSHEDLKRAIGHVSWKSHENGVKSPKAHIRKKVTMDQILGAPMIAEPLGLFDCCGVSDGAACAIVTTPEIARSLGKQDLVAIKAIQLASSSGIESHTTQWDGSYVRTTRHAARRAYEEAGITNPREQLSLMEVHDCFSITELVTMEDLFVSGEGRAVTDVLDGFYDADGSVPCQIDGGLKCFGHPIAASGLRMAYEIYNQLLHRAGERQLDNPTVGLTHNLGGVPYLGVAAISILGLL
ncbi:acetyl-CoA C-acetyltransferase [Trinickia symbiotica]|uniref:Acetyl-CoA acetyltransferase n=1 Tax=Trinickia symbiotica TaxID=863227 RepID=A0A2N7WLZ1_9BURK|nr:acetyl-CoA acetyltransferase [Trinickia symbiotica]PMS30446.1 acetyl-CoA acetyltransferase [Trinickia symbiotica]PPK41234.1 acetyl-CoA C-acetyltransferase [Trinickia symbiotica]